MKQNMRNNFECDLFFWIPVSRTGMTGGCARDLFLSFQCESFLSSRFASYLSFQHESSLSSQCVTLGSRYRSVCKSYNLQGILGTYVKNNVYDEIGWIPVSRTGMTSKSEVLVFHSNNGYAG